MPSFLHYRLFGGIKIKFKMRITKAIFLLGLIIILFFSLPFSFLINKKLAYYCYKELVYRTIINNVVGKERDPQKASLLLLNYFHQYLFTPAEAVVIDKDVYNDLMRGVAWCDQRSWALGTFLGKIGIDNRMVMTRNGEGVSNHTVTEVFINKRWRFLDPMYGFVIKDDNGELASYEDICRHPYLFYLSPSMLMLKEIEPGKYTKVKDFFIRNIFYSHPINPIIWKNPVSGKDPKRKALTKILDFYIFLFGNNFSYRYQDIYLEYFSPGDKGGRMFLERVIMT